MLREKPCHIFWTDMIRSRNESKELNGNISKQII